MHTSLSFLIYILLLFLTTPHSHTCHSYLFIHIFYTLQHIPHNTFFTSHYIALLFFLFSTHTNNSHSTHNTKEHTHIYRKFKVALALNAVQISLKNYQVLVNLYLVTSCLFPCYLVYVVITFSSIFLFCFVILKQLDYFLLILLL